MDENLFVSLILGKDENAEHYGLGGCYICIAKTLIMLGNTYLPCKSSSRIAFTTIFIGGIIIYYYWEAMLISYLAVRKIELPFRTLEELDKTNFKVRNMSINEVLWDYVLVHFALTTIIFNYTIVISSGDSSSRNVTVRPIRKRKESFV